jgi:hypothetical protein
MTKPEIVEVIRNAEVVKINGKEYRTEDLCVLPNALLDLCAMAHWKFEDIDSIEEIKER